MVVTLTEFHSMALLHARMAALVEFVLWQQPEPSSTSATCVMPLLVGAAASMATALAALGGADGLDFVHSGVAEELARLAAAKGALVACYEGSIDNVE